MLDAHCSRCQSFGDPLSPLLERLGPHRVVLHELQRITSLAPLRDLKPWPHRREDGSGQFKAFFGAEVLRLESPSKRYDPVEINDGCTSALRVPELPPTGDGIF